MLSLILSIVIRIKGKCELIMFYILIIEMYNYYNLLQLFFYFHTPSGVTQENIIIT